MSNDHKPRLAISFSGGRSSAVMLKRCLEKHSETHDILITFANTGREAEETLRFVDAVDRHFCRPAGHKVVWLEAVIHHGERRGPTAKVVDYASADRSGRVFEEAIRKHGVPCASHPQCTSRLKEEPMDWHRVNAKGWATGTYQTAIGIRADEIDRVNSRHKELGFIYPLADEGWTKDRVNEYMCQFDWDLKLPGDHWGNCVGCWKKSLRKLVTVAQDDPKVFEWWAEMEEKYGAVHRGKEPQEEPRTFYRERRSALDILALAANPPPRFRRYSDSAVRQLELEGVAWDAGSSCGESCEIGADELTEAI